ncbi:MAG: hypothetical protein JXB13_06315 [Phycisphaerae bacterium]|nr:hypothetical protein [Phycisphaerae bacterium]
MLIMSTVAAVTGWAVAEREFNGPYGGRHLSRVAFPIGGMGAGMYCLEGSGAISHMSVRHRMEFFHEPTSWAAVCVKGEDGNTARVLEGPIPDWKYFGGGGTGNGGVGRTYGFPRFRECEFLARFPFATIQLSDEAMPLDVEITGWSPFTPPDPDTSSLPVGSLEYRFKNTSGEALDAVFSFNTRNFMGKGSIGSMPGGFVLYASAGKAREREGAFAVYVDGDKAAVDHCWFRGGWWDPLTIAWNNVAEGLTVENPPVGGDAPGASLSVPFELKPSEEKTIRLLTSWYVPTSGLSYGRRFGGSNGPAFSEAPSKGTATKAKQQVVSGFLGKGLVNTSDPDGDGPVGTLTSPAFEMDKAHLHFLVGGGAFGGQTCVNLLVDGKVAASACGKQAEQLEWTTFDLSKLKGKEGRIQIVDRHSGPWGHILADHFVLSNEPLDALRTGKGNAVVDDPARLTLLADFEGEDYGDWVADPPPEECEGCEEGECEPEAVPAKYIPWYARQFGSVQDVADYWRSNYNKLRERSEHFRVTFYDTTLPAEAVEAVAANLTILKSPTVLRQHDGRLWCWEGCHDNGGCCAGSCAHVWNYAQAICHLFPTLAQGMRQTAFFEGQDQAGRQAFRVNLPIAPGGGAFDASDGHLGEIMKAHREWHISGDDAWLKEFWPRIKSAMDYAIRTWDPRHTGLLEEKHHNTYDINYFGPDGHCGSFYLGALAASVRMGKAVGADVSLYRELLVTGRERMEKELFNGEYFIQIVQKDGLNHNFRPLNPNGQSAYYRNIVTTVNDQGPKYQYGTGCLSDGVLGLWMARVCGIEDELVDSQKVSSHLEAIHKYNLKHDLSTHANPQRPTYAMGDDGGLLLCTWPNGGKPLLPFVYSDEVWTGIEYQVASHLILMGHVEEGLDIVRTCRRRYDGVRRNPFNEYECGHWYARALASYALLQALSGARYDAVEKTLYIEPARSGDFRAFISTATGFGTVGVKNGRPFVNAVSGSIPVKEIVKGR